MLLILTELEDVHANHIEEKLKERGADYLRFNPAQFPSQAEVSLSYSQTGQVQSILQIGEEIIELSRLKTLWFRRPLLPTAHENITDRVSRDYIQDECNNFLQDVWNLLSCRWVPAPFPVIRRAELKASQLKIAASLGFEIPPTLFSNSPKAFLEFYRQHNGNMISKLPGMFLYKHTGTVMNRYTHVVSKRDVGYADSVRYCPMIFQAYVPKRVELRITVVGQKVFAAEIHSQKSNHTRYDWRRYDRFATPYLPHELPRDIEQRCLKLVQHLGLCYGAIDMIITPDERYVFLEINPNGQYLWVEQTTGMPISDAMCDLLMFDSKPEIYNEQRTTAGVS